MKTRNFLIFILFSILVFGVRAQIPTDTIPCRYDKYFYTQWYDECYQYTHNGFVDSCWKGRIRREYSLLPLAIYNYTPQPLKVKGLVALLDQYCGGMGFYDTTRLEEYLFIYQSDSSFGMFPQHDTGWTYKTMILLDSARYDNVKPLRMMLPQFEGDTNPSSCYAYEAYFKSPVIVDSQFYIYSTRNTNRVSPETGIHIHKPLCFLYMVPEVANLYYCDSNWDEYHTTWHPSYYYDQYPSCVFGQWHTLAYEQSPQGFWNVLWPEDPLGFYLPIIDRFSINAIPDDSTHGRVYGGGRIPDGWRDTIWANPLPGYYFEHWSDGITDNPRIVVADCDTTFVAVFSAHDPCNLSLYANNDEWGSVEGPSVCQYGETVEIHAVPAQYCYFIQWSDGVFGSTRSVTITTDSSFTAIFNFDSMQLAIPTRESLDFHVSPNPVHDRLEISIPDGGRWRAEIIDSRGATVLKTTLHGNSSYVNTAALPTGKYIIRVFSKKAYGYKSFIKN